MLPFLKLSPFSIAFSQEAMVIHEDQAGCHCVCKYTQYMARSLRTKRYPSLYHSLAFGGDLWKGKEINTIKKVALGTQ